MIHFLKGVQEKFRAKGSGYQEHPAQGVKEQEKPGYVNLPRLPLAFSL
ncbi:MAG: hypothetical protein IT491_16485 [Gammaproteobacteria bacterium]|jgi:hypothetical protein|nr:hypothetical protein [Gammaproteobacteria bacterium]